MRSTSVSRIQDRGLPPLWDRRLGATIGACVLFILVVYVFFLSAGAWTNWPEHTRYYDELATAFRSGHLYLDVTAPASLYAMPDPYEPRARNRLPEVERFVELSPDRTFYGGRFYLYWGPAPAILLAVVKAFYAGPIPDQYLVFIFLVGLLIFVVLLILELRRRIYPEAPASLVAIGILVAGLACPLAWMLNRAAIYEATIAGGQFFLMAGLYFAYLAVEQGASSRRNLLLAVTSWALAGGARTLALLPAAFLTLMLASWIATNGGRARPDLKSISKASILGLPLALVTALLGWYNWARFGSALETGLRYTLTFRNLNRLYAQAFSTDYLLPNLWMYLLSPFQTRFGYPFISASSYGRYPPFFHLERPTAYNADAITGLLFSVPFVLLSLVALANAVALKFRQRPKTVAGDNRERRWLWISACLAGSALLPFGAILLYFNVTMRFIAEFLPSLLVLSILGLWQGYAFIQGRTAGRRLYTAAAMTLGIVTVAISLLLTVSQH